MKVQKERILKFENTLKLETYIDVFYKLFNDITITGLV